MSKDFIPTETLYVEDVLKIKEINIVKNEMNNWVFECEGNFMHFEVNNECLITNLTRYGDNDANIILNHINEKLGVDFVSEDQEIYWDIVRKDKNVIYVDFKNEFKIISKLH
jgi:hypothetical protein